MLCPRKLEGVTLCSTKLGWCLGTQVRQVEDLATFWFPEVTSAHAKNMELGASLKPKEGTCCWISFYNYKATKNGWAPGESLEAEVKLVQSAWQFLLSGLWHILGWTFSLLQNNGKGMSGGGMLKKSTHQSDVQCQIKNSGIKLPDMYF